MSQFHHKVQEEKSYRRAIFLAVSLALAGVCSVYPVMCFKNYSTKEKDKLNSKVAQVERKAEDAEEWVRSHRPRARHQSHSPPRIAHTPSHHHRQRHSSVRPSGRRESSHRRHRDEDMEMSQTSGSYRHKEHGYDRDLDDERRRRHHGHPPPRRYHHSS